MITVTNVSKMFGGLTAVNDVSFELKKGEILGLIGPNGSGKTTMFNLITGFLHPTKGTITYKEEDITNLPAHSIALKGISRTFQITSILMELTVKENIKASLFQTINTNFVDNIFKTKKFKEEEDKAKQRIDKVLELTGLSDRKNDVAKNIPPVDQRKLMIAIALASEPEVLMLDEPAAGTSREEQEEIIQIIKKVNESGITVLVIEHHMHVIMNACDRIIALNFGKMIAEGLPEEIQQNKAVIEAYLGSEGNVS